MSIKITQIFDERRSRTVLRVEGKLYLIDAEILEGTLGELQKEGLRQIEINLAAVSFLDNESAAVLRRLRRLGAILTDINFFVQKVIEQTESSHTGEETDQ